MKPIVLLILVVVWGVALIPPLLRSRSDLRPGSSVASFRRTLSDMSRIPGRSGGGQAYGRPMANPASPVRAFRASPGQRVGYSTDTAPAPPRVTASGYSVYSAGYTPGLARARANRAAMIRRRQNVLFTLVTAVVVSGIVGFALSVPIARTAFFVCLVFLAVYVWMLATLRRNEELRSAQRYVYSDAA
jgi:hypothetical protein